MYVTSIAPPTKTASVTLVVEDENGDVISLALYNQVDKSINFGQLNAMFPKGCKFGVKQPYMKLSFAGSLSLRNDNSQNVVFGEPEKEDFSALELKE